MYKTYYVTVNFAGFYGVEEEYEVEAETREEAEEEALEIARNDLGVISVREYGEDDEEEED